MKLSENKEKFKNGLLTKAEYINDMYQVHSVLFEYAAFLRDTNISQIEIKDNEVTMTFRDSGVQLICANNDKRLALFDTLNFGSYEAEELEMQMELIDKNWNVFDVGGNYGWYAIHIAKKFPQAKIFTFEPIPHTYNYLNKNVALNALKNVSSYNFGASDKPGSFTFYYDPSLSANASLQNVSGSATVTEVNCQVDTIDKFCDTEKVKIDFLKCDVEGGELLVFKGAEKTIARDLPIIFSEMLRKWTAKFNYHPNDIIKFLSALGYHCFVLADKKLKPFDRVDENTMETNYLFLHPQKHADKIKRYAVNVV